jgi:hypothetical protein
MRASSNTPHDSSMIECDLLPEFSCCHDRALASPERPSGRIISAAAGSSRITPSTIMSPASEAGPSTEIRLGVYYYHAQEPTSHPSHPRLFCERGPPTRNGSISRYKPCTPRLTRGSFTDKEIQRYGQVHERDECRK